MIKLNSFWIRFCFFSCRKNSRPGNRHPEHIDPKLFQQSDIFRIMMIKIASCMARIDQRIIILFRKAAGSTTFTKSIMINYCIASPICIPRTFKLIGRSCSAPIKVFRKSHVVFLSLPIHHPCHISRVPVIRWFFTSVLACTAPLLQQRLKPFR